MIRKKLIYQFVLLSIGFSWGIFGPICYFFISNAKSDGAQSILIGMMYIPTLVTIILTKYYNLGWKGLGLKFKNWQFLFYAIGIVMLYVLVEMLIQANLKTASYNIPKEKYFMAIAFLAPVASIGTSLFAFGEELGWRGFLQNLLIKEYGLTKGVLILGTIWGLWHMPVALLGYNLPEYPLIEAFIWFPLFCISLSFIYAWLTLNGKSVWWAVLAHGANNGIASMIESKTIILNKNYFYLIGLMVVIATGVVFYLLLLRKRNQLELYLPEKVSA